MICRICKGAKDETEFAWKNRANGRRSGDCKRCHNMGYGRKWYYENRDKRVKQVVERRKRLHIEARNYIVEYLREHPCVSCNESNIVVLEFDHNGKDKKLNDLARLIYTGPTREAIQREISKCQVLCANCHRIKTAKERGWYRALV